MIINLLGEELANEPCYQLVNNGEVVNAYQEVELAKSGSDCGANGPGGGGFQPGNTCGREDGAEGESQGEGSEKKGKSNQKVFDPDSGDITKAAPSPKRSRKKSEKKTSQRGTMRRKKGG